MIKKQVRRILETRSLPTLLEQRNNLLDEMDSILNKVKEETRALTDEESTRFETIKADIAKIDKTLKAEEEARAFDKKENKNEEEKRTQDEIINEELRCIFEKREAMNTKTGAEGGVVVNEELVKEIIKALKDRSDVYKFFNGTTIKGTVKIPKKTKEGKAEWVDENPSTDPQATIPNLELIELGQNRLYRESAITQQMLNTEELDLKSFIIDDISDTMIDAIEAAIFNGTGTKQPTGVISGITKKINLASRGAITFEDLKKCKAKLKKAAWKTSKWFMHSDTLLELDLLKDGQGRPLLQPDLTQATGYTILGIPVEVTDAMPTLAETGAKCVIVLATPNAYHTNTQKSMAMYVYDDSAFKRRGLVGYAADLYMDGKTKNEDQLAGIFNKSA